MHHSVYIKLRGLDKPPEVFVKDISQAVSILNPLGPLTFKYCCLEACYIHTKYIMSPTRCPRRGLSAFEEFSYNIHYILQPFIVSGA